VSSVKGVRQCAENTYAFTFTFTYTFTYTLTHERTCETPEDRLALALKLSAARRRAPAARCCPPASFLRTPCPWTRRASASASLVSGCSPSPVLPRGG